MSIIKKTILWIMLIAIGTALFQFCSFAYGSEKNTYNSFTYIIRNGSVILTNYSGKEESIVVPNTISGYPVTELRNTFENNTIIKSVKINEGIETIGTSAFNGCINLNRISLPKSVTKIGNKAFYNCIKLKRIHFPSNLHTIEGEAFAHTSLKRITIPKRVTDIYSYSFYDCKNLSKVTILSKSLTIYSYAFKETPIEIISAISMPNIYDNAFPDDSTISFYSDAETPSTLLNDILLSFIVLYLTPLAHTLGIPEKALLITSALFFINLLIVLIAIIIILWEQLKLKTNIELKKYMQTNQLFASEFKIQSNDIYYTNNTTYLSKLLKIILFFELALIILLILIFIVLDFVNIVCNSLSLSFNIYLIISVIILIIVIPVLFICGYKIYCKTKYALKMKNKVKIKRR